MNNNAYAATHDALTRLPNEYLLLDRMNQLVATSERSTQLFALLLVVPDNEAAVREAEGPVFADRLILRIAERLQVTLREPDTIARRKDNTFAILVPLMESRDALTNLVTRLRKVLTEPFLIGSDRVLMTFSLGSAIYPYDGTDSRALLQAAGSNLYTSDVHVIGHNS